jgi:tetratricopeptide (TPR) repeat protein
MKTVAEKHHWEFAPRFRRGAFGWRSQPAITRVKEAVTEIKKVARKEPVLAAEGAILFLEKVSGALQNIDSSSGAIGGAVNRAIDELVPIIAKAPAENALREKWLKRLYQAHADDQIPYIECLGDYWGELCATPELAAAWADRLIGTVEQVWSRREKGFGFFHGTYMCFSALLHAGRYDQLLALLEKAPFVWWNDRLWGVKALIAKGRKAEALQYAEASHGRNNNPESIAQACEEILLSSGMADEAYQRYAIVANQGTTYLATFRAICRKYPYKTPVDILNDLVISTPGQAGKWFAAAKDAGLYELAIELARQSPVDHRTLNRAAADFIETQPGFAIDAGLLSMYWILAGRGYEATVIDVIVAFEAIMRAATVAGNVDKTLLRVRTLLDSYPQEHLVHGALAKAPGLWG